MTGTDTFSGCRPTLLRTNGPEEDLPSVMPLNCCWSSGPGSGCWKSGSGHQPAGFDGLDPIQRQTGQSLPLTQNNPSANPAIQHWNGPRGENGPTSAIGLPGIVASHGDGSCRLARRNEDLDALLRSRLTLPTNQYR